MRSSRMQFFMCLLNGQNWFSKLVFTQRKASLVTLSHLLEKKTQSYIAWVIRQSTRKIPTEDPKVFWETDKIHLKEWHGDDLLRLYVCLLITTRWDLSKITTFETKKHAAAIKSAQQSKQRKSYLPVWCQTHNTYKLTLTDYRLKLAMVESYYMDQVSREQPNKNKVSYYKKKK